MNPLLAAVDAWRWQPHAEVWLLLAGYLGLAFYAVRVIGPKVVPAGTRLVTRGQVVAFAASFLVLWVASDWPLHDLAEEQLYFLHMVQHFALTLVFPPLLLLATPEWLARLLLDGDGFFATWTRRLTRPVPALVIFNALVVLSHWPAFVNLTVENGTAHYVAHTAIVIAAIGAWMPVCNPVRERRISLPSQMLYLFIMSILPTVPSAWMILAEKPLYSVYADGTSFWGMDVVTDQQAAGLFMKLFGGFYLWTIITVLFFRWAGQHEDDPRDRHRVSELTWDQVERELESVGPAPSEP